MSTEKNTIYCMRGLPGSGKSTIAKRMKAVRVNRDDLRKSMFGGEGVLHHEAEEMITKAERSIAAEAIKHGDVVVDAMNLRSKYLRSWNEFAVGHGADFAVVNVPTDVETCIRRDQQRDRSVGEDVIRSLASRFFRNGEFPAYEPIHQDPVEKVVYNSKLPCCIIVDLDGTMAVNDGHRGYYEWDKVINDKPNRAVVNLVNRLLRDGYLVKFVSGRMGTEECREQTMSWLRNNTPAYTWSQWILHMRKDGDSRSDDVVKRELFDAHVRGRYNVKFVLDDRNSVVRMWRSLGLPTFQVAEGDF